MRRAQVITALLCTAALAAPAVRPALAASGFSKGGAFRHPGYGARAWGMGGAGTALVDDEGAVYWNPAMLGHLQRNTIGASYINLVPGTTARQSQLAYAHVLASEADEEGVVAVHALGVQVTNLRLELPNDDDYDENMFRFAYAYSPDRFMTMGFAWELFFSKADANNFDANGTSVDVAVRLQMLEDLTVAIVARNVFSRYSYSDGGDFKRTRAVTVGAATTALPHVAWEGDVVWDHGEIARLIFGGESEYILDHLAIRGGIALWRIGEDRAVPYLGFGVGVDRLRIHYNANLDDENAFEDTHRFSLSVTL